VLTESVLRVANVPIIGGLHFPCAARFVGRIANNIAIAFDSIVTVTGGYRELARSNPVSCDGNRILPPGGGFGFENPKCRPRDEMSLMVEGVVDGGMDVEKPLHGSRRFEPLHLALASPHDLMGVFSAIVFSEASIMRAGEAQLPKSRAVGV
jgi:hypothetical protein